MHRKFDDSFKIMAVELSVVKGSVERLAVFDSNYLEDRKVIGWSLSTDMTDENTSVTARTIAIKNRRVKQGLIFHSDRGVKYAYDAFRATLTENI